MLLQQQGSRVKVARPPIFSGKIEEMSVFINVICLYLRIKIKIETRSKVEQRKDYWGEMQYTQEKMHSLGVEDMEGNSMGEKKNK